MEEYIFNVEQHTQKCVEWLRDWMSKNGNDNTKVIIGISGGKDSSVTAALLREAFGADRVFGVMMPNGEQKDISDSIKVCEHLGIKNITIDISKGYDPITEEITAKLGVEPSDASKTNSPARMRMLTLYDIAGRIGNCRVVNTCNRSEDIVGYATFYGDSAGDFSPINHLTTEEVIAIGDYLGLPKELTHKTPTDGMSLNEDGSLKSDEDKLGVSYKEINDLIRRGVKADITVAVAEEIARKFRGSRFKLDIIQLPYYDPKLPDYFNNF